MQAVRFAAPALVLLVSVACGDGTAVADNGAGATSSVIAATSNVTATPQPSTTGPGLVLPSRAPEFAGLEGWINSDPLTIADLVAQGRVVLVDFWTYTCINCIRTLPFVRDWNAKYADVGLTIVGVHAPEFEFEQRRSNVLAAVDRYQLDYPIAQDNEMDTWAAFNNSFWPAKYLIDADGYVRYQHFGEGSYDETEYQIRRALKDAGHNVDAIPVGGVDAQRLDPHATSITRELYGGYDRNYTSTGTYAAQAAYYDAPDRTFEYTDVPEGVERNHNQWYLQGVWRNEREAIVHARETEQPDDYIAFRFVARSVNVVLRAPNDEPYVVVVEIDGRPLAINEAGADVTYDDQGRSVIVVDRPRVYAVVELPALGDRVLKLASNSTDFAMYAVTFGAYTSGA